jgi:hypothetical protein
LWNVVAVVVVVVVVVIVVVVVVIIVIVIAKNQLYTTAGLRKRSRGKGNVS